MFFLFHSLYKHIYSLNHVFSKSESSESRFTQSLHSGQYVAILHFVTGTQTSCCVWEVTGRKERERGGLLTWLEWLFCSCAIICGGALRAALQHQTVRHTFVKKWPPMLMFPKKQLDFFFSSQWTPVVT